jgi:hypothetical protein
VGFLSKVGKGIKKAFKKVGKFVGKLASSKFGKILLIAAAVFTLGTALIAGGAAFASTAGGFAAKFVAAGKAFVGALASPLKTAKGLFNGAGGAAASAAGTGATAGAASATAEVAGAVGAAAPATTPVGVLAGEGVAAASGASLAPLAAPALAAPAAPGISLASQIGSVAGKVANFATSAQGLTLAGNAAQGFAAGKAQEEVLREQRREREFYDNQYRDPEKIRQLNEAAARPVNLSGGFIDRARQVSDFMNGRSGSGTSAQPGKPEDTYGRYVVGY